MARFIQNNERSEAIQLISLMNRIAGQNTWQIKSVGGESTLGTGTQHMFPDVFVYGDTARTQILQGWEVKMPDVRITDVAFIADAHRKADVLGVNSCVLWNFTYCVLYVKTGNTWSVERTWDQTSHIHTRAQVTTYQADWHAFIPTLMGELNEYFVTGRLRPARIGDIVTDTVFAEIIRRNKGIVADQLQEASIRNTVIAAHISQWWRSVQQEYQFDEENQFAAYAQTILLNWINKFTFAHLIRNNHDPARTVERIDEGVTPMAALTLFGEISTRCDFFNIFETVPHSGILPAATWVDLTDYNGFLVENGLANIPQEALQSVLENCVNQFRRNVTGLFATPQKLARILVNAGIIDLTSPAIDPCCGTGTIVKEILAAKEVTGIETAYASTYASDKFSFPLQVSNMAMTRANAMNLPSLLFRENAFNLHEGQVVPITDPRDGTLLQVTLPRWGSLISNLPFVAFDQEGREETALIRAALARVRTESGVALSHRADLYQALLLHLNGVLADNASVAVITSNSWLGTVAGQDFFRALNFYYKVKCIVASGERKWFDNADVVTLMLFLEKNPTPQAPVATHRVNFGLIHKALLEWTEDDMIQIIDSIRLQRAVAPDLLSFQTYSITQIHDLLGMNIALNSCFYDVNWLPEIRTRLCPVTDLFIVQRGMKTAQNEFYYLEDNTVVEPMYVGPVFKSARSAKRLTAQSDAYAFVCGRTLEELIALGHTRAIARINRFQGQLNQSVQHRDTFWMNIADGTFAGSTPIRLFTGMNPEQRIFYGLLDTAARIDQRAIGFRPRTEQVSLDLCHALLNSIVGVFYTEATGFPKGLGALDNCAENVERIMMLDPRRLTAAEATRILEAFRPLFARDILTTRQEYGRADRLAFERIVADIYGYTEQFERIVDSVLDMQRVRLSVKG